MGMQCNFSRAEAENANLDVDFTYDKESDAYSCVIYDKDDGVSNLRGYITANYIPSPDCNELNGYIWFDVGSTTAEQMNKLAWLIRRRVCFTVA